MALLQYHGLCRHTWPVESEGHIVFGYSNCSNFLIDETLEVHFGSVVRRFAAVSPPWPPFLTRSFALPLDLDQLHVWRHTTALFLLVGFRPLSPYNAALLIKDLIEDGGGGNLGWKYRANRQSKGS